MLLASGKVHTGESMKTANGARLALLRRGNVESEFPLSDEPSVIGRDPQCAIPLRDERASKRHASVLIRGAEVIVEDLQSLNGTRVNEVRIERQRLVPGDAIRIGRSILLLLVDGMPLSRSLAEVPGWVTGRRPGGGGVKAAVTDMPLLLGRAEQADIRLQDEQMPDFDLQFILGPNHTAFLKRLSTEIEESVLIPDGAEIRFGEMTLRFRSNEPSSPDMHAPPATLAAPPAKKPRVEKPRTVDPPRARPPRRESEERSALDTQSEDAPVYRGPSRAGEIARTDASLFQALEREAHRAEEYVKPPPSPAPLNAADEPPAVNRTPRGRSAFVERCALTATSGPITGQTFHFTREPIFFGRDKECAVPLDDPLVSRQHARLYRLEGDVVIEDLDSANGIFLNRTRIRRNVLRPGDTLRIGASEFLVHL